MTLSALEFSYRDGEYCGAGAPRFNVRTSDGNLFFFGCAYGTHTDLGDWVRVNFGDTDAFPQDGVSAWPGFGAAVIESIPITHDEPGTTHLDNITVNDMVVGGPNGNRK